MNAQILPVTASANALKANALTKQEVGVRCARCIMDHSDPEISFDEHGVCNHCHEYDRRIKEEYFADTPGALETIIETIRRSGVGRDYDCLLGVSGGVDSTYLAFLLKKHGLRPLAVHMDNGWNSELAVSNIENTIKKLGIDLYTHVVDWKEFKDLHTSFLKASVANVETPTDHAIVAILYREAAKRGIKYIIGGGNLATESVMPKSWMYDASDLKHLLDIHRIYGKTKLRTFPKMSLYNFAHWTFVRGIRTIPLLNYVKYTKHQATETLKQELSWRAYGGKHYESIFTKWFQAFLLPTKFKIDKRLAHYSSIILSGQMTREEGLKAISAPLYDPQELKEDTEFVRKKLGLTHQEMELILSDQVKPYTSYRSNARILHGMPHVRRIVKRLATQGRFRAAA